MYQIIMFFHVVAAVSLVILVVFLQQGRGAITGAAFGSGASQTVFGSRGSGSFLFKLTMGFVVLFFATSITLNNLAVRAVKANQQQNMPQFLLNPPPATDTTVPPTTNSATQVSPNNIPTTTGNHAPGEKQVKH